MIWADSSLPQKYKPHADCNRHRAHSPRLTRHDSEWQTSSICPECVHAIDHHSNFAAIVTVQRYFLRATSHHLMPNKSALFQVIIYSYYNRKVYQLAAHSAPLSKRNQIVLVPRSFDYVYDVRAL